MVPSDKIGTVEVHRPASAKGRVPSVIKDKPVHTDVNGAYFRLIKARTFSVVEEYASSVARAVAANHPSMQETPLAPLTAFEQTETTATEQIETVDPDSLFTLNAELLEQANTHFSLADKLSQLAYDAAGPLSHFTHIATALFNQMSTYCDPQAESTILHWDGLPSLQKQREHQRRQDRQVKDMDVLRSTVTQARIVGGSRRKAAYKKAKNVYRPPLGVIGEIIAELILTYGCNVCFCSYQADTCIARHCAQAINLEDLFVVSGDSDMITFKSIPRLIYPLGKHREMTVIDKADLLRVLELPSDNHLLLAAIVAGNDYTRGVPYYGLGRSLYVQEYLVRVQREILARKRTRKNRHRMDTQLSVGVEDVGHALRAFVEITENPKLGKEQESSGDPDTAISQMDLDWELSKTLDGMPTPMEVDGAPLELTPAPSPDQASALQGSTPHELVVNVLYQLELDKLVRDTASPKQQQPPTQQHGGSPTFPYITIIGIFFFGIYFLTSIAQQQEEEHASSSAAKTKNADAHPTPALLKDAFKATYKTITQIVGPIKACLRRGIGGHGVSDEVISIIAFRLESAAHLMADTRVHVFHMLTMLVLDELTRPNMESEGSQRTDPLDLLLSKAPGTLLIRNLATLILDGRLGKKTSQDFNGIAVRNLAQRTYDQYKEVISGLRPLNTTSINTGDNIMEFDLSVFVPVQTHFKKSPNTIVAKMRKLGWDDSRIPRLRGEDKTENANDHSLDMKTQDQTIPGSASKPLSQASTNTQLQWDLLRDSMPQQFGYRALQGYVNRRIAYNKAAASARDRGVPYSQVPPEFPINNQSSSRYAINNFIRTDGLQLQVLAYDTRSRY
ncbi:hypothetical protein EC957_001795 [Mortierella hygrophila]|uniref:Uncharacterized protein n=1 Tax=Mortierella hygrophila TaxID=979708 RepID=A0A9P6K1M1_9FUNG|nr:hypothetical protein EC957_001795 [Mortierella hygrophila]